MIKHPINFGIFLKITMYDATPPSRVAESELHRRVQPVERAHSRILGSSNADFCLMLTFAQHAKLPADCMFQQFGVIAASLHSPDDAHAFQIHARLG